MAGERSWTLAVASTACFWFAGSAWARADGVRVVADDRSRSARSSRGHLGSVRQQNAPRAISNSINCA
jgi:hypothetical protein